MLRIHLLQNWFGYSDPAMEEALYETTILRQFAGLGLERIPDETTILNFRRLLGQACGWRADITDECRRGAPVMWNMVAARLATAKMEK